MIKLFLFFAIFFYNVESSAVYLNTGQRNISVLASKRTSASLPFTYEGNVTFIDLENLKFEEGMFEGLVVAYRDTKGYAYDPENILIQKTGALAGLLFFDTILPLSVLTHFGEGLSSDLNEIKIPFYMAVYNETLFSAAIEQKVVYCELHTEENAWEQDYWWFMLLFQIFILPL